MVGRPMTLRKKKGSSFIKVIDVFLVVVEGFSKIMILTRTKTRAPPSTLKQAPPFVTKKGFCQTATHFLFTTQPPDSFKSLSCIIEQ